MEILTKNQWYSDREIRLIEKHYNVKYVVEIAAKLKNGQWSDTPAAVFYQNNKHPTGSNYLGIFNDPSNNNWILFDALPTISQPWTGAINKDGQVIFSRYRHDFRESPAKDFAIDGGRDYVRIVGDNPENVMMVKLGVQNDKVIVLNE